MKKMMVCILLSLLVSVPAMAATQHISGLKIKQIRAVGNYAGGNTTYDDSVEVWFTTPLAFSGVGCSATFRVYIALEHLHLISAAYAAQMNNKAVGIQIDDTLPMRNGSCEISYLDVVT